ncbi:hypothetical protein KO516_19585 [Citreicella sp. C3M06]|uniref:hypothetical protein n=1 Tax=Citreicella sp. C3M06 TaxID=2841564 RepID=UPI001C09D8AD|nr:hypothetical protein [Citreicella sp. C3M06]MBU2962991.1 hypothetical protein [Citreicella sp. C3M06]
MNKRRVEQLKSTGARQVRGSEKSNMSGCSQPSGREDDQDIRNIEGHGGHAGQLRPPQARLTSAAQETIRFVPADRLREERIAATCQRVNVRKYLKACMQRDISSIWRHRAPSHIAASKGPAI